MSRGHRGAVALAVACLLAAGCRRGGDGGRDGSSPSVPPSASSTAAARSPAVRFAVWGDTPYSEAEAAAVERLVEEVNAAGVDFVVNIGDIKGGGQPCDDAVYTRAAAVFGRFTAPLVYVPGDNEWTDCHVAGSDPLERLAHLRRTLFATDRSFGASPLVLTQQRPAHPEHSRWQVGGVQAVGLNVPGGNNNSFAAPAGARQEEAEAEHRARDDAVLAWLRAGFDAALASGTPAVAVFLQADPRFEVPAAERATRRVDGYDRLLAGLVEQAGRVRGPVVVAHGDTHLFRHDRPLLDPATGRPVANVVRVETYGSPLVGWVEITLDPAAAEPVRVDAHLVEAVLE